MKPQRKDRLASEYQRAIASIVAGPLKDKEPRIKGLVSVTEADVAPDLKTAKIYVSVYAPTREEADETFNYLLMNAGFIRHELSQTMRMRTVPYLTFLRDGSMEYGSKMDELFSKLHKDD